MTISNNPLVGDDLRPSYFFSYSRQDFKLVEVVKNELSKNAVGVWHDVDRISVGDDWRAEINTGIQEADEIIIFISNASVSSNIVEYEIELANSLNKTVRPFLIERLGDGLPSFLSGIHYIDLTKVDSPAKHLAKILVDVGPIIQPIPTHDLARCFKQYCVREIWPRFSMEFFELEGRKSLSELNSVAQRTITGYPPTSTLTLNAGLISCSLEYWDVGLENLRYFAQSTDSFTGWYMYALHLNRGKSLSRLDVKTGNEVMSIISRLTQFGSNALTEFFSIFYQYGFTNRSLVNMELDLGVAQNAQNLAGEDPVEFTRLFWNLRKSTAVFGSKKDMVVAAIRRNSNHGK